MVYTNYPVFVDGTRLDAHAWNIDVLNRATAGTRANDVAIPGVDGVAASLNDDLEPFVRSYSMWVRGVDSTGVIPGGSDAMAECLKNVGTLTGLFRKRSTLLDVQEVVDASGTLRQAWCKVIDPIAPEVRAGGIGRFTVSLLGVDGLTQDPATTDVALTTMTSGVLYELTGLQGSLAPICDATILVTGPATNPRVTDQSGSYIQLNAALTGSQQWRINSATWTTRYGTGLTLASADTAGTDGNSVTFSGGGGARMLRMEPRLSGGVWRTQISLTASAMTTATRVDVRARRKFYL